MHYMLYQLHHCWSCLYLKHYLNLMYQLMMCLSIGMGSICHTLGPKGGGDCRSGTAGISVDGYSCNSPVGTCVSFGRAWFFFIVLGKGLPIPGIDFFEDFPLLTLVVANLELANSFWVPLGGLRILLLITSCLDPMLCLVLILLVRVIDNKQGDGVN